MMRGVGATSALLIGLVLAVILAHPEPTTLTSDASAVGVVLATILGWLLAPRAVKGSIREAAAAVVEMTVVAVLAGAILVSALGVGQSVASGSTAADQALPVIVIGAVLGLVFVGLPAVVLVFAASVAWALLCRGLALLFRRHRRDDEGIQDGTVR